MCTGEDLKRCCMVALLGGRAELVGKETWHARAAGRLVRRDAARLLGEQGKKQLGGRRSMRLLGRKQSWSASWCARHSVEQNVYIYIYMQAVEQQLERWLLDLAWRTNKAALQL